MLSIEIAKPAKKDVISEWREYKDDAGNVLASFLIAGSKRPAYQKGLEAMQARFERVLAGNTPIDDNSVLYIDELIQAAGRYLILDWTGISTASGDFEYSQANAITLLTQTKDGLVMWSWIKEQADDIQNAADGVVEDLVGKPLNSTSTKASPKNGAKKSSKPSTKH
ncbi:MAG: hypothetical protein EOO68_07910 [Moraxellaceae bacterium]|nr:MAG: hypothetical protein EOO68_07910 [Moraxellaceae bacterium]